MPRYPCKVFGCAEELRLDERTEGVCRKCRDEYSPRARDLMIDFNMSLADIIIHTARTLHTAQRMGDYLGVSLPTLYGWIKRVFDLTFLQFQRKYVCSSRKCIVLDYKCAGYSWKYTLADRLTNAGGCTCFIEHADDLAMTTLTPAEVSKALGAATAKEDATDIHHLRYPVRLPIYSGGSDED